MAAYYEDSLESFRLSPLHLSRGNRRLVAPYILLSSLLSIVSYLGGSVMRGASDLITADHLNRFSNGSPSLIRVARDWHVLWPDLGLALASLYPDSARDPAGDLWRYLVTSTMIAGGRESSWHWLEKGFAAARFKRLAWNTLWIPGGVSNL